MDLVSERLFQAGYKAKTVAKYREGLRAIVQDDKFWSAVDKLQASLRALKRSYV